MRMEMPDCVGDISGPLVNGLPEPALCHLYGVKGTINNSDSNNATACSSAKCLFLDRDDG